MQCRRTCRDLYPFEPEAWCGNCTEAEAEDREANMLRWRESLARVKQERARRENLARWEARFQNAPEECP